jgi:hypothetical protein
VTKAIAATQQLVSFCDAIMIDRPPALPGDDLLYFPEPPNSAMLLPAKILLCHPHSAF